MEIDILAFGVHPDDVELGAGGTLAKEIAAGKKVVIIDLTRGELGTRGNADLRLQEADHAAKILGCSERLTLDMRDGFIRNDEAHQMRLIPYIRYYKPRVVLCNAISDRHPDHAMGSELVSKSCFLAGLRKIETIWDQKEQSAWRPTAVYHYIQDYYLKPDFVVDITDYYEIKLKAVMAFSSQFYNPNSDEPETAISGKDFIDFLRARAIEMGRRASYQLAEGFIAERYLGLDSVLTAD